MIISIDTQTAWVYSDPEMQQEVSKAAAILGRKGGSAKTKAKAKAARRNGKLGGRPRKKQEAAVA